MFFCTGEVPPAIVIDSDDRMRRIQSPSGANGDVPLEQRVLAEQPRDELGHPLAVSSVESSLEIDASGPGC